VKTSGRKLSAVVTVLHGDVSIEVTEVVVAGGESGLAWFLRQTNTEGGVEFLVTMGQHRYPGTLQMVATMSTVAAALEQERRSSDS
jgi:hypothetical protein